MACALVLPLLLAACAPKTANATPTMGVQAIYTAAYQTLLAQQATQLALTPPTNTPLPPTKIPTLAPASPLPTFSLATPTTGFGGGGTACNSSAFVADVTIPDNTVVDPGKAFTKTWTLLNNGTCTWDTTYKLAFQSGDQMGGATTPLTASVAPGSSTNISVKMTAPTTNGTYKGTWQMQNGSSQFFGDTPWVLIKVGSGSGPTATAGTPAASCTDSCEVDVYFNVDTDNVTINFTNATSTPTLTAIPGGFKFTVQSGWTGTLTPIKGSGKNYAFSPASATITVTQSPTTVNFTAVSITPTP